MDGVENAGGGDAKAEITETKSEEDGAATELHVTNDPVQVQEKVPWSSVKTTMTRSKIPVGTKALKKPRTPQSNEVKARSAPLFKGRSRIPRRTPESVTTAIDVTRDEASLVVQEGPKAMAATPAPAQTSESGSSGATSDAGDYLETGEKLEVCSLSAPSLSRWC